MERKLKARDEEVGSCAGQVNGGPGGDGKRMHDNVVHKEHGRKTRAGGGGPSGSGGKASDAGQSCRGGNINFLKSWKSDKRKERRGYERGHCLRTPKISGKGPKKKTGFENPKVG